MRYKPKDKKITVMIVVIALLASVIAVRAGFASTRSATRIGYIGNEGWSSWSGRYFRLNGTMEKAIHPKGSTIHVAVETESGTFSMEIRDREGNVLYQGSGMETSAFDVEVPEKIVVRIVADSHKGSFSIE